MGMYTEQLANTNLKALADIQGINSITGAANGLLASVTDIEKRARVKEYFYDKVLLDTIEIGSKENVYLKYCSDKDLPEGNTKLLLRRWGGLTEHTVPLKEGVPPISDRMSSESFTGTFAQYGRYMEFSDRVDFNLIDDVITHYSIKYGELAIRTAERLCREEMVAFSSPTYAHGGADISGLIIGDKPGIEDYRLQALIFSRLLVAPIGNSYKIICSQEHLYDLVEDPLVQDYMRITQTAEPYKSGKPVELFNLSFETTMLDDFAYGYTDMSNPGEYDTVVDNTLTPALRLVTIVTNPDTSLLVNHDADDTTIAKLPVGTELYMNFINTAVTESVTAKRVVADAYLKDGSAIPDKVTWKINGTGSIASTITTTTNSGTLAATGIQKIYYLTPEAKANGNRPVAFAYTDTSAAAPFSSTQVAELAAMRWMQLPVHRSFMFGTEHMIKTGISGRKGAKFFAKPKGSAGVLDPIDQRQSIGFKIDTLGFTSVRPEAMVQFIFVPEKALITYSAVVDDYSKHYNDAKFQPAADAVSAGEFVSTYPVTASVKA